MMDLFDFSTPLSSSLETSLRRGAHENCKKKGKKKDFQAKIWIFKIPKGKIGTFQDLLSKYILTTKSSGEIQLSPNATPALKRLIRVPKLNP